MQRTLLCLIAMVSAVPVQAQRMPFLFPKEPEAVSPAQVAVLVHKDLQQYSDSDRYYLRYLYLHNLPTSAARFRMARVLAGHNNGMSCEPDLKAPQPITPSGAVYRIDLRWYGWNTKTWDLLLDPYSTIQSVVFIQKAGVPWKEGDGKTYDYDFKYIKKGEKYIAPHLSQPPSSPQVMDDIYKWTGSFVPMVRGDWFLSQTATQEDKVPGYYDFLGVKDEKTFEELVRFDRKLSKNTEHVRGHIFSGIVSQPRRTSRKNTVFGGYRESFDSLKAVGLKNPLIFLDDQFEFDISEKYAPLPNGFPAWFLGDNKGNRADKALDGIVGADMFGAQYAPTGTKVNDNRLQINVSCISCHYASLDENGVKNTGAAAISKINEPDYYILQDLTRKYLRDIELPTKIDRLGYYSTIKSATGWEPAEYAVEYRTAHSLYEFGKIGLKTAAREMGVNYVEMGVKLAGYDLATGNKLHPMLSFIRDGGEIPRRQWEEAFPEAMRVYYSTTLIPKEK